MQPFEAHLKAAEDAKIAAKQTVVELLGGEDELLAAAHERYLAAIGAYEAVIAERARRLTRTRNLFADVDLPARFASATEQSEGLDEANHIKFLWEPEPGRPFDKHGSNGLVVDGREYPIEGAGRFLLAALSEWNGANAWSTGEGVRYPIPTLPHERVNIPRTAVSD